MAGFRLPRAAKRAPLGFCAKVSFAIFLGLAFVISWSTFSAPSSSDVSYQRSSFGDIEAPPSAPVMKKKGKGKKAHPKKKAPPPPPPPPPRQPTKDENLEQAQSTSPVNKEEKAKPEKQQREEEDEEKKDETVEGEGLEEVVDDEGGSEGDLEEGVDVISEEDESGDENTKRRTKNKKKLGPLFQPNAHFTWKLCGEKAGNNYMPCLDMEGGRRHHERSCPRTPAMCLVALPEDYKPPLAWPDRESKVWYKNVDHPKRLAFIKTQSWLNVSDDFLLFPPGEFEFKGGPLDYINSIEEMVPDIQWGKNIRVLLDIGCVSANFGATLLEKNVITLTLGLMSDQADLAQLALERGIPAVVGGLVSRRLPFPSGVFDAVHCGDCNVPWHSNGGRLLLEMNRIIRPGGYFITSSKHGDIETEEGMSTLISSISWTVLAHRVDEVSEVGIRIYQRPASNDVYELRSKGTPFCKSDDNQDSAWYTPIRTCLHKLPAAIEERGTDWPEEWPKRLDSFPEWLSDSQERLIVDQNHWKAVLDKSYLIGLGIDWSNIRNVMDMKAINGGFAAALTSQKVWVMNVVPVHAPNTLPIIFERGLVGIYHDWCEPFSSYPRSYDLLHADHLFSRLKNRCKQPVVIVVEMDRLLRPGGWAIIRDKLEILNPLEAILRSLHWEIVMTYGKDKEGIICTQKTTWRP